MKRLLPLAGVLACIAGAEGIAGVESSSAQTTPSLYVDGAGRGGACSDGFSADQAASPSTPWCSLDRAAAAAPSASTVLVRAATYPQLAVSGDEHRTSMVTLMAYPGEQPVLQGLNIAASSFLRIQGFAVTDSGQLRSGARRIEIVGNDFAGQRMWLMDTVDVLVEGNAIHDIPSTGVNKIGIRDLRGSGTVIRNNTIERLVEDPIQLAEVKNALVEGNVLQHAHPANGEHTDCIQVLGADGLVIRDNAIRDVEHCLMFTNKQASNVTIENNVVSDITGTGFKAEGTYGMPNLRVVNNTWQNTGPVELKSGHAGAVVANNIFGKVDGLSDQPVATHNLIGQPVGGVSYGDHAILGAPMFTDATTFEMAAGRPGIDGADSNYAPQTDRLARGRYDDPAVPNTGVGPLTYVDIGAMERGGRSSTPVMPPAQPGSPQPGSPQPGSPLLGTPPSGTPAPKLRGNPTSLPDGSARMVAPARIHAAVVRRAGIRVTLVAAAHIASVRVTVLRNHRVVAVRRVKFRNGRVTVTLRPRGLRRGRYQVVASLADASGHSVGRLRRTVRVVR